MYLQKMLNESVHIQQELQDPAVQSSSNPYIFNLKYPDSANFQEKVVLDIETKNRRAVFPWVFRLLPPSYKLQADMTLLDQIFSKERTLSTSLTEKVGAVVVKIRWCLRIAACVFQAW